MCVISKPVERFMVVRVDKKNPADHRFKITAIMNFSFELYIYIQYIFRKISGLDLFGLTYSGRIWILMMLDATMI